LEQAVKCKHCATVLRARPRTAAKPAPATPSPAAPAPTQEHTLDRTAPSPAAPSNPFDLAFEDAVPGSGLRRRAHRGGAKTARVVTFLVVGLALAGGLIVAGVRLYPRLTAVPSGPPENGPAAPATVAGKTPPADVDLPTAGGPFPRRILAVSVSNYLYANPISYGAEGANARQPLKHDIHSLLHRLGDAWHIPPQQRFEVSDGAPGQSARPPLKGVVMKAIESYLAGSRPQDRVVLLFAGHVVEIDNEAYLVPLEGELTLKNTLIPLKWVYEKLAACRAQQKLFIVDVCRSDPARGEERPVSGPMKPAVDAALKTPPPGVQVLASCSAGQYSYEYEYAFTDGLNIKGSVFLNTFFAALMKGGKGISRPEEPLPVQAFAEAVIPTTRQCVQNLQKTDQTAHLSGAAPTTSVPFDGKEESARAPDLAAAGPQGGALAGRDEVRSIFLELDVPPIKAARGPETAPRFDEVIPFSADVLAKYKPDVPIPEIRANPKKYPLRVATLEAFDVLNRFRRASETGKTTELPEELRGDLDDKTKAVLKEGQKKEGAAILEIQEALEALEKAAASRKDEKSPRWQAHYDYATAGVKARLAYLYEYQLMFGKARKQELPPLDPKLGQKGWRLASREKIQSTGEEVKELANDSRKLLAKLVREHPGTPWEVVAKRERFTALGLQWQPTSFGE
jgi:hypothetical protein